MLDRGCSINVTIIISWCSVTKLLIEPFVLSSIIIHLTADRILIPGCGMVFSNSTRLCSALCLLHPLATVWETRATQRRKSRETRNRRKTESKGERVRTTIFDDMETLKLALHFQ